MFNINSTVCYATEEKKESDYNTALWYYNQAAREPERHEYFKNLMNEIRNKRVMTDMEYLELHNIPLI